MDTLLTYTDFNNLLFKDNDKGFINVFRKGFKGIYSRSYKKENLSEGLQGYFDGDYITDLYCTLNTFITPDRRIETLRYMNALYIDIDCYKLNMRKESVLFFLENDFYNSVIPVPSLIVDSGRGLYLIWLLERVPSQAINLWKAMQYYLYNALKEFGADRAALDAARVLRVIGSYNMKSDSVVKVIEYNNMRYSLKELKNEYLPEIKTNKDKEDKKKSKKGKLVHIFNIFALYKSRMVDLLKLAELRNYNFENRRELFLFLLRYYVTLAEGEDEAEKLIFEINEKFVNPLPLNEIKSTFSNYIGKYKYRNETIVELLEVSKEEMLHMTSLVSKEFKYEKNNARRRELRRNSDGLTTRELSKKEKFIKIVRGIEDNKNTKEISEEYNLSIRIVQKYKKELLENQELYSKLKEEINIINTISDAERQDQAVNSDYEYNTDYNINYKEIDEMFEKNNIAAAVNGGG